MYPCGRVSPAQNLPPGSYARTIALTLRISQRPFAGAIQGEIQVPGTCVPVPWSTGESGNTFFFIQFLPFSISRLHFSAELSSFEDDCGSWQSQELVIQNPAFFFHTHFTQNWFRMFRSETKSTKLFLFIFQNKVFVFKIYHYDSDVSRHRHSPLIALTEEDTTKGELPIKEFYSPEPINP
ncbi:hypothetical protein BDV25DRAFT_103416 [Aspergillus avenaceus]|uniref:Uncharacterized protein n=1 Tax=Aspergillus avenaceus TaxID=36643 RepID=A0A5N6TX71_ASPAV|nr:hypothetical protein BDV25DRAFT_103416 [Aspergillus avenaceus]